MRHAFTLLELLVVIALLTMVASAGLSLVDTMDSSARDASTLAATQQARHAVLGPEQSPAGYIGRGFIQDLAELPSDTRFLRGAGPHSPDDFVYPDWQTDNTWGVSFGWRGPYLPRDTAAVFHPDQTTEIQPLRDGWGNSLQPRLSILKAWSLYAPEPYLGPVSTDLPILSQGDWLTDVQDFPFFLTNNGALPLTVRLRCLLPNWDQQTDSDPLGLQVPEDLHFSPVSFTVPPGETVDTRLTALSWRIPRGLRSLVVVDDAARAVVYARTDLVVSPDFIPNPGFITLDLEEP
jgi:prepilin-type N-terminal cleavage/methylation domain-containing protein